MTFGQFLLIWFGIGLVELLACVCGSIYGLAIVEKRFDHSDEQVDRFVDLICKSFEKYFLPKGHLTTAWGVFHWMRDILFAPISIPFAVSRAIAPVAIGMLENFEYDLTVEPVRVQDFKRVVDEVATEVYKDITVSEGYDEEGETNDEDAVEEPMDYLHHMLFDKNNPYWRGDFYDNVLFFERCKCKANETLGSQGYLFLNDLYKMLGFNGTKCGDVNGWVSEDLADGGVNFKIVCNGKEFDLAEVQDMSEFIRRFGPAGLDEFHLVFFPKGNPLDKLFYS